MTPTESLADRCKVSWLASPLVLFRIGAVPDVAWTDRNARGGETSDVSGIRYHGIRLNIYSSWQEAGEC
jgi:hypothetical protein